MIRAAIFDLDDTLLDTGALLRAREAREWDVVLGGLDSVVEFAVEEDQPAVVSLPKEASSRGLAVGLFTHSPLTYTEGLLRRFGIRVDEMVTGSDRLPPKPDPTGLIAVSRALGIDPEDCVYIGDNVGDFGAAASAGMLSIGVSWDSSTPESWRHGWPNFAVNRPSRLLNVLDGKTALAPMGEVLADGTNPQVHWGSILRLGANTYGLGRYFPKSKDRRYPAHSLSHLILGSKDKPEERERLGAIFAAMSQIPVQNAPEIIASVPPSPEGEDRFEAARGFLAEAFDAEDRGPLLKQLYGVDDYKSTSRDARGAKVKDRFEATDALDGERLLLIDDVINTGSQAEACRLALLAAGAKSVAILSASVNQDALPRPCPNCGDEFGGIVRTKTNSHTGEEFLGCSRFWRGCGWSEDPPS